ncbi:hypothetical protein ACIBI8_37595 [Streptomyces sp. NPDC050529]|uniref:hypothetical protein n=1 Tax=Streptomyces sp. NPDC050529 TaxID=3365624 RepID=UPI0037AE4471
MAQWNLSVDLRGSGNNLARTLQTSARHARALATAARDAQGEVRGLGTASRTAQGHIAGVGRASEQARTRLLGMARQARSAAGEFRDLARAAELAERRLRGAIRDVRITARLDDDTAAGRAALRTSIREIQALSPVRIRVRFDGDSAQIAAAAAAMRDLHTHADRTDTALTGLATRSSAAALALRATNDAANDLARTLRTLRGRAAAAAAALDELRNRALMAVGGLRALNTATRTTNNQLNSLSDRTRTLRTDLDDLDGSLRRVGGRMGDLRSTTGSLGSSANSAARGTNNLMLGAVALATALIPIAASAAPIAAGLTAAGIAIGVFGGAVAGQIVALTESAEAEEKYQKAVREHGSASSEAATAEKEYLRTVHEMPAATREAAAGLSVLKNDYKDWSNALAGDTMPVVTKSMSLFGAMLPRLTPLVKGTSKELDRLLNVAAGGMRTPGFDRFVTTFTQFANDALARGTSGIIKFTQALDTGKIGDNLREFLTYARTNGPLVADTLGNLAQAAMHLLAAASDMGVSVLTAVNALAKLVNAVPAPALSAFLQLYAVLKLVSLGVAMVGTAAGGAAAANLAAFVRSARFAGVGPAISGVVQRMSALQKASVGLAVLGLVAIGIDKLADKARGAPPDVDRLTTSLKQLAATGQMTGELKKTFGDFEGIIDSFKKYQVELGKDEKASAGPLGFRIPGVSDLSDWLGDKVNDLSQGEGSLNALKEDFEGVDEALAQMVSSGNTKEAAAGFDMLSQAGKKAGMSTKDLNELFPDYKDSLANLKAEQQLTAAGMGIFGKQAQATKAKLDAQKASADGLRQSIVALNDVNRTALGGMIGFEAGIDAAAKAAKENAGSLRMVNGELDLNSPKAQAAATALADLGAKTDAATTAARDSGKSWEYVNGIYKRGEQAIVKNAMAMGLSKTEAAAFAATILTIPDKKSTLLEMRTEDAIIGLDAVIAKIKATPGAKSVTVKALTTDAVRLLENLGYRVETLKDGRFKVTALTGEALAGLAGVKRMRDGLKDKTVRLTTIQTTVRRTIAENNTIGRPGSGEGGQSKYADGGIVHRAAEGLFVPGYAPRQDTVPAILSPGEGVLVPETVRKLGAATGKGGPGVIKALNMWGRYGNNIMAFSEGGTVPQRFASGGVTYAPTETRRSTSDVQSAYSSAHQPITKDDYLKKVRAQQNAVDNLHTAEVRLRQVRKSKHSHAQLVAAENQVSKARRSAATATEAARKAESRYKQTFSLSDWQKTLKTAVSANASWEANLNKIASRGGTDVIAQLRDLGEEGASVVSALAKASNKQFNDIVANLKKLGPLAKASLADYTKQLATATRTDTVFQGNLSKLAGQGYGDLATQLAGQGDEAAQKLAAEAVKSKAKAASANSAAKKSAAQLSSDELGQLIQIIAAVKTSKTGLHDVASSTGLGEDEVIAAATKGTPQIKQALGDRAAKFLIDLNRANKGLAYADGGIRPGIYSTTAGAVTFAEPSTGGEAYIPLGASKRGRATDVLRDVAGRFGVGLTDASGGGGRVVIVREQGPLIGSQTWQITSGGNATDTAREIDSRNGYQLRRLARGGVANR